MAGEDSDDGEWRVPAAHVQPPARPESGMMPLFVPVSLAGAGPSPTPPAPRPGRSEPQPARSAADIQPDAVSQLRPARSAPAALSAPPHVPMPAPVHAATPASSALGSDRCPLSRRRMGGGGSFGAEVCSRRGAAAGGGSGAHAGAAAGRPKRQAAAAAEAAAREARFYDADDLDADEEEEDEEGFGHGYVPLRGSQLPLRQAAVGAAALCASELPAPAGFEPCVRTTDAKPDGWTEYTVRSFLSMDLYAKIKALLTSVHWLLAGVATMVPQSDPCYLQLGFP